MLVHNITSVTRGSWDDEKKQYDSSVLILLGNHEVYSEPLAYSTGRDEDDHEDALRNFASKLQKVLEVNPNG